MTTQADPFYIGWQPEMPERIFRRVSTFLLVALVAIPLIATVLVMNQQGFATSVFELGEFTEMEGVLTKSPAPFIQVFRGRDQAESPVYQNVLLVARGKHGALEMIEMREKGSGKDLNGTLVSVKGFLIYHDGKTLMEVEEMEAKSIASILPPIPNAQAIGKIAAIGEITDPKCLFGVMKPGYGKPHRSCAALCIKGGIPPVLKRLSPNGDVQYLLLTNEKGEPVNQEVLPHVGKQVMVCGEIKQFGDWLVLYKTQNEAIIRIPTAMNVKLPVCGD